MKMFAVLLLLGFVGTGAVHAACQGAEQDSRVIYGGKRLGAEDGLKLVCVERTHTIPRRPRPVESARSGMRSAEIPRLEAMDKEGVSLILARELAHTEAELVSARRQDDGQSEAIRSRIHRLEKDLEALQGEISRVHKRQ